MSKLTKNQKIAYAKVEAAKAYKLSEAAALLKEITFTKFDASVDIDVRLGVDPRKANQMVRGVVTLPHGTGKTVRVLVLCTPEKEAEAEPADAKKKDGWFNKKAREMDAVKAKLDAAEKNAAQAKDQLLRMAAEYENYRKRSTREADQKFNDGVSFAVNQIIPILDTLEMAANAPTTDENYKKGVTMTLDKAAKALDALHVEEIEALGKPFDPNFMNAVQQIPAPDGQESGTVITVYQKGYKLGDKIVRHATVVVAE